MEHPEDFISFEDQVHLDHTSFIDGMIPKRYIVELPVSQHPRWVVTCNFEQFYVYDMEKPGGDPEIILLENLPNEYYRLEFLVKAGNEHLQREMEVSIAAGEIVGLLYDAFAKQ